MRRGFLKFVLTPFLGLALPVLAAYDASGVRLGSSESEVEGRFPGAHCKALEWKSRAADRRCDDAKATFGGAPARITFYLKDDQVQAFDVRLDTRDVERVAKFLKSSYGQPSEESRDKTDARGRPRETYRLRWDDGDQRAVLTAQIEKRRASLTVSRGDFEEEIYRVR
jgi:hypothetical protein